MDPNFNISLSLWSMLEASVGRFSFLASALDVCTLTLYIAVVVGALPSLKILVERRGDSRHTPRPKYPRSVFASSRIKGRRKRDVYGEMQEDNQGIMLREVREWNQTINKVVMVNPDESRDPESGYGVSVESFIRV